MLHDIDQEATDCKVKQPQKQKDAVILAIVKDYHYITNKRNYLKRMARFTSATMKL